MSKLLFPLEKLYGLGMSVRNLAYDYEVAPTYHAPLPVVSVGNLAVGGTGKTPHVQLIANAIQDKINVAIVSRGYKGKGEKLPPQLVDPEGEWSRYGDEPVLLARNLPKCPVIVGRDRVAGVCLAKDYGADVALLDDGMQHRRLIRDMNIVLVDGRMPLNEARLLPGGRFREGPKALKRADYVIVTHAKEEVWDGASGLVMRYTAAPIIATNYVVQGVYGAHGRENLEGKRLGLLSAIARPDGFVKLAREYGEIVHERHLSDHAVIDRSAVEECAQKADIVVCTEKDWVKFSDSIKTSFPIVYIKIVPEIISGTTIWRTLINQIVDLVNKS